MPAPIRVPADLQPRRARSPVTWAAQATADFLAEFRPEFGTAAGARGPIRLADHQVAARFAEEAGTVQNPRRRRRHREGEQRRKRKRGGRARKSARNSRS